MFLDLITGKVEELWSSILPPGLGFGVFDFRKHWCREMFNC